MIKSSTKPSASSSLKKSSSDTMMEVLITFPLRDDIDLTILEEFMLIIYQPNNIDDDRFDKVGDYDAEDYLNKPLLFTQKSATNHVILDGIHEISFRLELPRGAYVYLHKQRDRLLLNQGGRVATLGNGRKVNYVTPDDGCITFEEVAPQPSSPKKPENKESGKLDSYEEYYEKQIIGETTPIQRDTINRILNGIEDSVINSSSGQGNDGGYVVK